jgi:hypothetical protein
VSVAVSEGGSHFANRSRAARSRATTSRLTSVVRSIFSVSFPSIPSRSSLAAEWLPSPINRYKPSTPFAASDRPSRSFSLFRMRGESSSTCKSANTAQSPVIGFFRGRPPGFPVTPLGHRKGFVLSGFPRRGFALFSHCSQLALADANECRGDRACLVALSHLEIPRLSHSFSLQFESCFSRVRLHYFAAVSRPTASKLLPVMSDFRGF